MIPSCALLACMEGLLGSFYLVFWHFQLIPTNENLPQYAPLQTTVHDGTPLSSTPQPPPPPKTLTCLYAPPHYDIRAQNSLICMVFCVAEAWIVGH